MDERRVKHRIIIKYSNYSLFLVSMIIVTGPSLTKDTCISAPKLPENTSLEIDSDKSFLNFSYNSIACSFSAA